MDFADNGDLSKYIHKLDKHEYLQEKRILDWFT